MVSTYNWSGDVEPTQHFQIVPSYVPGYYLLNHSGQGWMAGTYKSVGCDGVATTGSQDWSSFLVMMPDANGPPPTDQGDSSQMFFATPPGQSDFSGTRLLDTPQANGGTVHQELTYDLHKTCTLGGTDC
jgi:hypothetical protein